MARVTPFLVGTITVVALLLAALGAATTAVGRRIGLVHLAGAGLLELLLLVQAGVAVVALTGGTRPADLATFLSYLVGVLLVPVAGVLWARTERTRWAGTVIAVAALAVAVMVWRLLQLWEAAGV
jgi:hypothetical protein